ncbi:proline--tRNA ligase [Sporosarcina sp. JAI121]|uniref:proline--tRNA ligase n=1 Tax=Sporosarcina sp. JAI121 TaxID=2723064 RepID=UPI0015CBF608|nr:proline--tRNA ligase [Sporosarcina sp. JAI121]NYF24265.1 prolyl-tRNA synthetase [Sporosarcina sp. JAI121]
MKQSRTFIPTMREVPSDADIKSHQLLLRAGFIRQNTSGIYSFLPLGKKVLQKIEAIVRDEMEAIEAVEVFMPAMQLAELWQETGRWYSYGPELFRVTDRHKREFALGATHEEVITSLVRDEVKSYKKLPLTMFQIQTKFRDEQRPRFGLLRGREFIMKDAYSFHSTEESLDVKYQEMKQAYANIFTRLGLNFRAVLADGGSIGGTDTHEFMALSDIGEDTIAYSDSSSYAANIEMAEVNMAYEKLDEALKEVEKVATPDQRTISEVASFLDVDATRLIKTLIFKVDEELIAVLCRGDYEINDIKLKNALGASEVEFAYEGDVTKLLSCEVGSIGPVKLPIDLKVIADHSVASVVNGVCGANEDGFHLTNVNPERDFAVDRYEDLRFIREGDASPDGNGTIKFAKGIELGHIFKLGTTYSEPMEGTFLDENGRAKPYIMGCYGIGISRILAAVAEQYNDEQGLKWPKKIAPYDVHLIAVNPKDESQKELADELYTVLKSYRYDVLYDDRSERAGVKFADSDLIGLPVRITVGKKASEGIVEIKFRQTGETAEWQKEELTEKLQAYFTAE